MHFVIFWKSVEENLVMKDLIFDHKNDKYNMFSKSTDTEAVSIKTEIDKEWNVHFFFQNTTLGIQHIQQFSG